MSKAFTRESDDAPAEQLFSQRPRLPVGAKNYITQGGADRLRHRLDELLEQKRSAAATEGQSAERQGLEAAIRRLESVISSVVVAEPPADQEKVGFGASVLVQDEQGEQERYEIVGVDEADPRHNRISWVSPLARALQNRRVGEHVTMASPAGERKLRVLKIEYKL